MPDGRTAATHGLGDGDRRGDQMAAGEESATGRHREPATGGRKRNSGPAAGRRLLADDNGPSTDDDDPSTAEEHDADAAVSGGWVPQDWVTAAPDRIGTEGAGADHVDDIDHHPEGETAPESVPVRARRARGVGRTWGRFAELWVPESLREARVDPGRRGALVLLLVAALAAVVTAVGVWRDRPEARAVDTSVVAALALSGTDVSQTPSATTAHGDGSGDGESVSGERPVVGSAAPSVPSDPIVASVTGLVAAPGLVTLPPGSRVADAIAAAGGTSPGADLTGMNLAARIADGDSIVVGSQPAAAGPASGVDAGQQSTGGRPNAAGAGSKVDLNTADEAALDTLPGVGPVMAANIIAWREANGRFANVEQLQEISGIGPSRYAQISPLVMVS